MSSPPADQLRRVVPRWRASRILLNQKEAKPVLQRAAAIVDTEIETRRAFDRWLHEKSIECASDVVISAVADGNPALAFGAAEQIIREQATIASPLVGLARLVRYGSESSSSFVVEDGHGKDAVHQIRFELRRLRERVRQYGRDAFAWHDLALLYARVGASDAAERAGRISVGLAPENRIILRSAARLFIHLKQPDSALRIIRRSDRTSVDPWLASVEIAVSDMLGKTPRLAKKADQLLKTFAKQPDAVSELAASLGTFEALGHGSSKRTRQYFRAALQTPSENVVAQARFVDQQIPGAIEFDQSLLSRRSVFEGRALYHYQKGEWTEALKQIDAWLDDEPFSSRPASLGSFIAGSILADPIETERVASRGLLANPHDSSLLNNLAYGLAYGDNPEKAKDAVARFSLNTSSRERIFQTATRGLVAMKTGGEEFGRALYREAILFSDKENDHTAQVFSRLHFAIAELEALCPDIQKILELLEQGKKLPARKFVLPSVVKGLESRIRNLLMEGRGDTSQECRAKLLAVLD